MPTLESPTLAKILAFVLALILAAVASAAQAALYHINRGRLRHLVENGLPRAQAVQKVFDEPTHIFATILAIGTLGIGGALGSVILLALEPEVPWPWGGVGLVLGGILLLLSVQFLVRAVAIANPDATALLLIGPLGVFGVLLGPVLVPLRMLERFSLRALGLSSVSQPAAVAQEELRMLVETVEDSTALEKDEREMIHGIFEMSQRPVREVMVPRIDIVAESSAAAIREVLDRIVASGYSRIPVYEDGPDNVVGIVYAKDLLRHLREGTLDDPIQPIARPAYFVPESKKVDELLQNLQQKRVHMAIVVDEYGGTAGLITIEDLLEEIVGEIQDEYYVHEEELFQQLSEREAIADAKTPIREVNEALELNLNGEEFDTLGGLVYHELGKVPVEGDEISVDGCLVRVLGTQGRRIKKLRVTLMEETAQ